MTDLLCDWSGINIFLLKLPPPPNQICLGDQLLVPLISTLAVLAGCYQNGSTHTRRREISRWRDYGHKHNKAHVAVAINANFGSVLRVVLDGAQHGCHSRTA